MILIHENLYPEVYCLSAHIIAIDVLVCHWYFSVKPTANLLQATYRSSGCISVAAAVQPKQSARPQQAQTCQAPWEQLCVQQSGRPAQDYSASFDKPPVSDEAGHVPVGQHPRLAGQTAGSMEALHALDAPMNLYKGKAPIRLPPLPLKIIPRGPKQNLKYWKTVPHGLPEATEKRL